jgi:hypothetical protein
VIRNQQVVGSNPTGGSRKRLPTAPIFKRRAQDIRANLRRGEQRANPGGAFSSEERTETVRILWTVDAPWLRRARQ